MKKNKILKLCLAGASAICLGACSSSQSNLKITKITDYLYETDLNYDFDYSYAKEYYAKYMPTLGGCSAISIGSLRGRNYDWEYSEGSEFIVRTSEKIGTNKRHASIGISSLTGLANSIANDGNDHQQYNLLPFATLDGINDAGMYVNLNVVGFGEMGSWNMKTSSVSDDMCELVIPRLILDKCATLSDVITELDKVDWFPLGNNEETHCMITGPRSSTDSSVSTIVIELIPFTENGVTFRKACVISNNEADKVIVNDEARFYKINTKNLIMTNFNLWHYDPSLDSRQERIDTASNHPMGYERYEHLAKAGGSLDSVTKYQMSDIMKQVYFSNAYNLFENNFWYTDYTTINKEQLKTLTEEEKNPQGDIEKVFKGENNTSYNEIKKAVETWNNRDRSKTKEQNLWETIHTSVFDYNSKSFWIIPHEGSIHYEFKL